MELNQRGFTLLDLEHMGPVQQREVRVSFTTLYVAVTFTPMSAQMPDRTASGVHYY